MLFAEWDGCSILILFVVLGFLGEGVTRLTNRMFALRPTIRGWAVGLGIISAILYFFIIPVPRTDVTPEFILSRIFQSGTAGFCAGLVWFLVVAVLVFLYQHIVAPPFRFLGSLFRRGGEVRPRTLNDNSYQKQRRDDQLAAAQAAATQSEAQKRRADARAACELLYHRHAHVLASRFPKTAFDDFLAKYMGDNHLPEQVENRGRQLQGMIIEHVQSIEPPKTPYTIESLADWYTKTKQLIEDLPVDDRYKQAQLAQLNTRYAELMQSLMETLQP